MSKLPRILVGGLLLLPLTVGCIMPDDIKKLEKDVADVKAQLRVVQRSQEEVDRKMTDLAADQGEDGRAVTRDEILDLKLQMERLSRSSSVNSERLTEIDQRFDRVSQELAQTRQSAARGNGETGMPTQPNLIDEPAAPSAGGTALPDPEALYNTAYADFSKGNYALAVSGFQEFQQRYGDSPLADNALYWIAECHFSQANYGPAVDSLEKLLNRYPESDKAPSAHLKKALAFQEQNQIQRAIVQYQFVVAEFPETDEGRLARDKLTGLGHSN